MKNKMMGYETEYAVSGADRNVRWDEFFKRSSLKKVPTNYGSIIDFFLSNGARFYIDGTHPEYCTPECDNPFELARQIIDGDSVVRSVLPESMLVMKHNVDYGTRQSWGSHESYMTSYRPSQVQMGSYLAVDPFARALVAHLATRIVYTGAGGFNANTSGAQFLISPRAAFLNIESGHSTTSDRGILNTRDEPLMTGARRLHLVCGESVRSHLSMVLRAGTTAIVVALAEKGLAPKIDDITNFANFMKDVSRDHNLRGAAVEAIEVQEKFLKAAVRYKSRLPDWAGVVIGLWKKTLESLKRNEASKSIDWAMKKALFEKRFRDKGFEPDEIKELNFIGRVAPLAAKHSASLAAKKGVKSDRLAEFSELVSELKELDIKFGMIGGIFDALDRAGVLSHAVRGVSGRGIGNLVAPHGRAAVRGKIVDQLSSVCREHPTLPVGLYWSHVTARLDGRNDLVHRINDPFAKFTPKLARLCKSIRATVSK